MCNPFEEIVNVVEDIVANMIKLNKNILTIGVAFSFQKYNSA